MRFALSMLLLMVAMNACGCGGAASGPEVAEVSGTVTLDGKPLPKATVMFQPADGRPSFGTTDDAGNYRLQYAEGVNGAVVGPQKVMIRTEIPGADGEPPVAKEILPKKFHEETELTADVKPGKNDLDFNLTTK